MKRFLYSLLFVAASGFTLASCNNGDYDIDPATNFSDIGNPLTAPQGGKPDKGQFIVKIGGAWRIFGSATYTVNGNQRFIIAANQSGDKTEIIQMTLNSYDSARTYDITSGNLALFTMEPTANPADITQWSTESPVQTGSGRVTVTTDANDEMKGTFSFTAYKELPVESSSDRVEVTDGRFYIPKI